MKTTSILTKILCLAMVLCTMFLLCACPGGQPVVPGGDDTPPTPPDDGGNEGGENGGNSPTTPPAPAPNPPVSVEGTGIKNFPTDITAPYEPISFGDLSGGNCSPDEGESGMGSMAGATLDLSAFPVTGRTASETVPLTGKEMIALLRKNGMEQKIYRLTDTSPVKIDRAADRVYDFHGAIILATVPLVLNESQQITLKDLTWINVAGNAIEATGCTPLHFEGVEAAGKTALSCDAATTDLTMTGCRLIGLENGLSVQAVKTATICDSAFAAGACALSIGGADVYVENCLFNCPRESGVVLSADDSRLSRSTLRGHLTSRATNLLIDSNLIYGTPVSVTLDNAYNAVGVLNVTMGMTVTKSHAVHLVDNRLYFNLTVSGSDYVLADGNYFGENAGASATDSTHLSGDSLTDTSARAENGALESLLPQVDRDLFVGMTRKTTVREREGATRMVVPYLRAESGEKTVVILPPGAYSTDATLTMNTKLANVTVYAYGVLLERETYGGSNLYVEETDHLTIKGMAFGHPMNSSGNAVLVAKRDGAYVDLIAGAGMLPNWTDGKYYSFTGLNQTIYGYRPGHPEPYADMGTQGQFYNKETGIITLKVSKSVYNMMEVGDTITCRGAGATAIQSTRANTLSLIDVTVYGAAGFALNDSQSKGEGIHLTRLWVTPAAAPVIDKATYDRYRALEEQYSVSFGLSADGEDRLRGTPHKMSSVDATHSSHSKQGITAISCLFESMCDDGTNQCSAHARMAGWTDLGNGKIDLLFKSNISAIGLSNGWDGSTCIPYSKGEQVYLYRTDGLLVCDTVALSDARELRKQKNEYGKTDTVYAVTIDKAALDFEAIKNIDFDTAAPSVMKVCVDNRSWQSNGFLFDNCMVRNIRSRGLLLKASDGVVKNCSIISTGMAAINIGTEVEWGESGISQNVKLLCNYIENSGHYSNVPKNSAIYIHGMGTKMTNALYLNLKGIEIAGNRFVDRRTNYAIYVSGAAALDIHDNDFGTRKGAENDSMPPVRLESVRGAYLANNIYPATCLSAYLYEEISGADVEGLPSDPMMSSLADAFIDSSPTWSADGKVTYRGNWKAGYVNRTNGSGFTPYTTYLQDVGWLCAGANTLWGGNAKGGLWIGQGYCYAAQANYNVVLTYTAPESGLYRIRIASYIAPGGDGVEDGLYAVLKNNREFVWPEGGNGNYNDDRNYYRVDKSTDLLSLQKAFEDVEVYLEAGDVLYFTARRAGNTGWSRFAILPIVLRPEEE